MERIHGRVDATDQGASRPRGLSPDGTHLVLGSDREYAFWNTASWTKDEERTLPRGNLSETTGALAYSRDGRWLAVARERELVQLLDAVSGREIASLNAPEAQGISWLRFSANGSLLAAATFEGAVQLWDLRQLGHELTAMNLGWNSPPTLVSSLKSNSHPAPIQTRTSSLAGFVVVTAIGVVLAFEQGRKLVRSMLGYSRESTEESAPFALPELVEDTVALLSRQFLGGIVLTLELDRETAPVQVSRSRVEQILLNLIVNASESMDGKGTLQIMVRETERLDESPILRPRPAESYVELIVADSGCGIPSEILPRIFEPFFTTKNRGAKRGTGLGLSMVYSMAEQEGLGLTVETERDQGARFRLIIPHAAGSVRESHTIQSLPPPKVVNR